MEIEKQPLDLTGLDSYYQQEFKNIYDSNETYKGKWNWSAFFFPVLWCLNKRCWIYCVLFFIAENILINIIKMPSFRLDLLAIGPAIDFRPSINQSVQLIVMLFAGWRGNWIYYNSKIKAEIKVK